MLRALALFFVLSYAFPSPTAAFVEPPVLVPPTPVAGQLVSISVTSGVCDAFTADPPTITRTGNNIRIVLASASEVDPFCVFPTSTDTFSVRAFEVGNYTLQVDRTYIGFLGQTTETLGVIPFGVSNIAQAPALRMFGAVVLVALVIFASMGHLRRIRAIGSSQV